MSEQTELIGYYANGTNWLSGQKRSTGYQGKGDQMNISMLSGQKGLNDFKAKIG